MSAIPDFVEKFDSRRMRAPSGFLDFIMTHSLIVNAEPALTEIDFDLDETLFRYERDAPADKLVASWRPETLQLLGALRLRGFVKINVLSSKSQKEIDAAMDIFGQQFGVENAATAFDALMTTRDYHELGNKHEAFPVVARQAAAQGRQVIFVDDARLSFDQAPFGFIYVPREMQYYGNGEKYTADLPA